MPTPRRLGGQPVCRSLAWVVLLLAATARLLHPSTPVVSPPRVPGRAHLVRPRGWRRPQAVQWPCRRALPGPRYQSAMRLQTPSEPLQQRGVRQQGLDHRRWRHRHPSRRTLSHGLHRTPTPTITRGSVQETRSAALCRRFPQARIITPLAFLEKTSPAVPRKRSFTVGMDSVSSSTSVAPSTLIWNVWK